ncbi:MAG: hypothetical protein AAF363_20205 [Bacteroidota bacterium]
MSSHLISVDTFGEFKDLPALDFDGDVHVVRDSPDLRVTFKEVNHYAIYKADYKILPEDHPEKAFYIVFDIDKLRKQSKKVFKMYDVNGKEITLGRGTYDLGLNFSGGRVYADTHFLNTYYKTD